MAHRRSGAQRRAAQKTRQLEDQWSVQQPPHQSEKKTINSKSHASKASSSRGGKAPLLKPQLQEVVAAIQSLYDDELKPFGRLLRKRLLEYSVASAGATGKPPEID